MVHSFIQVIQTVLRFTIPLDQEKSVKLYILIVSYLFQDYSEMRAPL